ncbi:MAG TPA: hypothetical protein VGD62_04495 [Acidobacteriaceae bacterium]
MTFADAMRFLYLVFVASIAALVWAAYAMARSVLRQRRPARTGGLSLKGGGADPDDQERPEAKP